MSWGEWCFEALGGIKHALGGLNMCIRNILVNVSMRIKQLLVIHNGQRTNNKKHDQSHLEVIVIPGTGKVRNATKVSWQTF